jgi:hypothetical protein
VTDRVFDLTNGRFEFQERGTIAVKGMGEVTTYVLLGRRGAPLPAAADPAPV